MVRILGVVPARGGSKRVPRKNLQVVGGITLVERAFWQATEAHLLDHLCVSTEDEEIARRMGNIGADVVRRPAELARDDTPMAPVLLHAYDATGRDWDAVVTIQPTSPLRFARDIDRAIFWWATDRSGLDRDVVISVNQDTEERNGAVYVTGRETLGRTTVFFGDERDLWYLMPAERSLDVNTPEDLEAARRILGD